MLRSVREDLASVRIDISAMAHQLRLPSRICYPGLSAPIEAVNPIVLSPLDGSFLKKLDEKVLEWKQGGALGMAFHTEAEIATLKTVRIKLPTKNYELSLLAYKSGSAPKSSTRLALLASLEA
jgi:hypothetical protein